MNMGASYVFAAGRDNTKAAKKDVARVYKPVSSIVELVKLEETELFEREMLSEPAKVKRANRSPEQHPLDW